MSIQEHLDKIRNAIYGREVRESIAKGIETAYDDASENGNANMEVKIARGTHPNLRSRLEEVDNKQRQTTAQLAQKASNGELGELSNDLDRKLRELGNMTPVRVFDTVTHLQNSLPTGAYGVYIVQEDGYWYYWNADGWTRGGVYQATPWDEFMTENNEEWVI